MKWEIGDVAICVKTDALYQKEVYNAPPLRKGAEYTVNAVRTCECGTVSLDVGIGSTRGTNCSCGGVSSPSSGVWWCASERFVKKQVEHKEDALLNQILETNPN